MLYDDLLSKAVNLGAKTLAARVRNQARGLRFAKQRGFSVIKHSIEMKFDLLAMPVSMNIIVGLREQVSISPTWQNWGTPGSPA
jgi:hypothetical protein